jgi:hypothetical protein
MISKLVGARKLPFVGIIILVGLGGGIFCWQKFVTPAKPVSLARVDLNKLLHDHPDWDRYRELQTQIDELRDQWGRKNVSESNQSGLSVLPELRRQISEIEQNFRDESRLKLANMNKAIADYVQDQTQQARTVLKERFTVINNSLTKELQDLAKEHEKVIQAYWNKLQTEQQVVLSNLQLRVSLLELYSNKEQAKMEKQQIQAEIDRIKTEINLKKVEKEGALQSEFQAYAAKRKQEITREFEEFKHERETEVKKEILEYRQKLEDNFKKWRQHREQELNSAKKLREEKWAQEYSRFQAKKSLLKARQEQIQGEILWKIRQKTKEIAYTQKIDYVLAGEFINLTLPDLTGQVHKTLLRQGN